MILRRCALALSFSVLLCLGTSGPAAAAGKGDLEARKTVGETDTAVAHFRTATCKRGKTKKALLQFYARSESTNGDYVLRVLIFDGFKGYRQYPLAFGMDADPYVSVTGPDGTYTSLTGPPFLPVGGAMKFSPKGKSFSLGIVGVFNKSLTDGVALAGAVDCKYPKKKKKSKSKK